MVKHFFKNCPGFFFRGSFLQRCSLLFVDIFSVHHIHQILAVLIFLQWFDVGQKLVFADPAVQVTDLLQARNLAVLMRLDGFLRSWLPLPDSHVYRYPAR